MLGFLFPKYYCKSCGEQRESTFLTDLCWTCWEREMFNDDPGGHSEELDKEVGSVVTVSLNASGIVLMVTGILTKHNNCYMILDEDRRAAFDSSHVTWIERCMDRKTIHVDT